MELFEDRVCGSGPLERLAIRVVGGDTLHELLGAGEGSAADGLIGD